MIVPQPTQIRRISLIRQLDNLPRKVKYIDCSNNCIAQLNNLPDSLEIIYCYANLIEQMQNLPLGLKVLYCYNNKLNLDKNTHNNLFQNLPASLKFINYNNKIEIL